MAEIQQPIDGKPADPGIQVPGEQIPQTPTTPQLSEVEQRALEQGWRPKEDWDGNPEDWRDAKTYIDRGELLGKLKTTNAEVKELKQMLSYMSEHNKKVYVAGYQKAIADLKTARVAAMKDENFEAVAAIEEQIDQNKEAMQRVQQTPAMTDTEAQKAERKRLETEWLGKNGWYKTEASMRHWANGMAMDYKRVNPGADDAEIYEFLDKEVRKEFPSKFKRVQGAPNPDGEGSRSSSTKTGGKGDFHAQFETLMREMPEDQAKAARKIVKTVPNMTEERYLRDYGLIKGGQ